VTTGPFGRPVVPDESDSSSGASAREGKSPSAGARATASSKAASTGTQAMPGSAGASGSTRTFRARKCAATAPVSAAVQRQSSGSATAPSRATL
jgi:hypothetical protein